MAEAYLDFEGGAPLYFECVTSELSDHTAEVSDHPVEQGSDISDHVRNNADEITLEIMVSNTPIRDPNQLYNGRVAGLELKVPKFDRPLAPTPGALVGAGLNALGTLLNPESPIKALVIQYPEKFNNVAFMLGALLDYKERGVIGKVITPHRTYPSMLITGISMKRDGTTGNGAPIAVTLRQVRIVESKLVTAPIPTQERGKVNVAKGRQPTSFVRDPGPKKSLALKLQSKLKKFLGAGFTGE